jgi:hypothetical protein
VLLGFMMGRGRGRREWLDGRVLGVCFWYNILGEGSLLL